MGAIGDFFGIRGNILTWTGLMERTSHTDDKLIKELKGFQTQDDVDYGIVEKNKDTAKPYHEAIKDYFVRAFGRKIYDDQIQYIKQAPKDNDPGLYATYLKQSDQAHQEDMIIASSGNHSLGVSALPYLKSDEYCHKDIMLLDLPDASLLDDVGHEKATRKEGAHTAGVVEQDAFFNAIQYAYDHGKRNMTIRTASLGASSEAMMLSKYDLSNKFPGAKFTFVLQAPFENWEKAVSGFSPLPIILPDLIKNIFQEDAKEAKGLKKEPDYDIHNPIHQLESKAGRENFLKNMQVSKIFLSSTEGDRVTWDGGKVIANTMQKIYKEKYGVESKDIFYKEYKIPFGTPKEEESTRHHHLEHKKSPEFIQDVDQFLKNAWK